MSLGFASSTVLLALQTVLRVAVVGLAARKLEVDEFSYFLTLSAASGILSIFDFGGNQYYAIRLASQKNGSPKVTGLLVGRYLSSVNLSAALLLIGLFAATLFSLLNPGEGLYLFLRAYSLLLFLYFLNQIRCLSEQRFSVVLSGAQVVTNQTAIICAILVSSNIFVIFLADFLSIVSFTLLAGWLCSILLKAKRKLYRVTYSFKRFILDVKKNFLPFGYQQASVLGSTHGIILLLSAQVKPEVLATFFICRMPFNLLNQVASSLFSLVSIVTARQGSMGEKVDYQRNYMALYISMLSVILLIFYLFESEYSQLFSLDIGGLHPFLFLISSLTISLATMNTFGQLLWIERRADIASKFQLCCILSVSFFTYIFAIDDLRTLVFVYVFGCQIFNIYLCYAVSRVSRALVFYIFGSMILGFVFLGLSR